jgi:penicillin-binding protein 1B
MPPPRNVRVLLRWLTVLAGLALGSAALLIAYGTVLVDGAVSRRARPTCTRVLSAPLVLRAGEAWDAASLRRCLTAWGIENDASGAGGSGRFVEREDRFLLRDDAGPRTLRVTAAGLAIAGAGGEALREATFRPAVIGTSAPDDAVRWPVPLAAMAPVLLTAVVDIEDRGFLSHSGLSLRGLVRAAVYDLLHGGARQGGSTITQQLAKVLLLKPARTVPRKIVEAWLATLLEYRYDKRTILQAYLNSVYLGQDGGWQIQGVEAASHYYFGKRAVEVDASEAALLAGLIAAPNRFDPLAHPEAARERRARVLEAMVREGHLERALAESLAGGPVPTEGHRLREPAAAHFVDLALARTAARGDFASTLDAGLQAAVGDGCRAGLAQLERLNPRLRELARQGDPLQVAVAVVAPDGRLLAVLGSRSGVPGELDRAVAARRQIGSLVKPFVVAAALEGGWTPASVLLDEPFAVGVGPRAWRPENSDGRFRGVVTVRDALVHSLNVPMARLGMALSVATVARTLRTAGIEVRTETPALLLGAVEASPLQVARAYAAFVNGGRVPAVRLELMAPGSNARLFEARAASETRRVLEEVPFRGTAGSLASSSRGRLAAKTGTTDGRRDSWFVALRPRMVVAVWAGTDGNRETGLFGATGALEIFRQIEGRVAPVWTAGEFPGEGLE